MLMQIVYSESAPSRYDLWLHEKDGTAVIEQFKNKWTPINVDPEVVDSILARVTTAEAAIKTKVATINSTAPDAKGNINVTGSITEEQMEAINKAINLESQVTELAQEVSTKAEQTDVDASVTDLEDRKANKDGYYTELTAGMAEQLLSPDGVTDEVPYLYRTTAGDASVSTGVAEIKQLKGNSLVWNQLSTLLTTDYTAYGLTYTYNLDTNTFNLTGTTTELCQIHIENSGSRIKDHKYLILTNFNYLMVDYNWGTTPQFIQRNGFFTFNNSYSITRTNLRFESGVEVNITNGRIQTFDLTQMYGAGNEPTTVEEFKADFPLDYYEYNAGEIINVETNGLKTVGFNLCEVHNLLEGTYTGYANYITDASTIIEWFKKIQKLGQNVYYTLTADQTQKTGSTQIGQLAFRNSTEGVFKFSINPNGVRDLSSYDFDSVDAVYIYAANGTTTNITDVCFNLVWSGYRNGEYESYNEHNISLPVKSIKDSDGNLLFPNGLLSAGSVYDEITSTKAIKRVGVVDLGSLSWGKYTNTTYQKSMFRHFFSDIKNNTTNCVNPIFSTYSHSVDSVSSDYQEDSWCITNGTEFRCYKEKYQNMTESEFKTAMSGVKLYYELATPIEVDFADVPQDFGTTLNMTYFMDDFGTEEFTTDATGLVAPVAHSTFYMTNLRDKIRTIDGNTDEGALMNDSLANLLTTLGTALGGTLTRTWNETNANWDFTFTANTTDTTNS